MYENELKLPLNVVSQPSVEQHSDITVLLLFIFILLLL